MKPNTPSKQRVNVLLLVGLLCWSTPGFGTGHELTPVSGNPARGRDLFIAHGCLTCHAVRGSGGRTAPDLAAAMVDAGMGRIGAAILDHPPGSGPPAAPAYPSLQAADRDDLLAYFFFVNFAGESGSAANGALVFSRKGCTKCHWAGAAGDASVPRALSLARSTPPVALAQLMWNHVTQMSISPAEREPPSSSGMRWLTCSPFSAARPTR